VSRQQVPATTYTEHKMEKHCDECGSSRFRTSRFRLSDLPRLFLFQSPIRCLDCRRRSHASVLWVLDKKRERAKRMQTPR
jgi:hypothetical protein